ncbi:elongator complex protein 3 [Scatolibacter rhodanostii]|uniref:elongator complex protein 3 n=1 Tax=Scatolibacter rhodanostii TaxID=2014781 RepID=UPI001FA934B9|nr:radical SAM protein [Scatolibacter rhodanostii]
MPHVGCPCHCSFCNQREITGQTNLISGEDVHHAVLQAQGRIVQEPESVEIAFFGGSFTAIRREYMLSLLEAAYEDVTRFRLKGIRVSTRPDAINGEILSLLKKHGVTAIELGAQSLSNEVLVANRRGHTAKQVEEAAVMIQEFGFELGLQMMTGLYQDTPEKALETAQKIIQLKPDTVRIYPTLLFKDTYLYELWQKNEYTPQGLEEAVKLCAKLIPTFEQAEIKVIRVGLHAEGEMQKKCVAGPFHPAFKELCLSQIFYERLIADLQENLVKTGEIQYTIKVNPKYLSVAAGQKKSNEIDLKKEGFTVQFVQDSAVAVGEYLLETQHSE